MAPLLNSKPSQPHSEKADPFYFCEEFFIVEHQFDEFRFHNHG